MANWTFWILAVVVSVLTSRVSSLANCSLMPLNNKTFVDSIYAYFSADSQVKVLEYTLTFSNVSTTFNLEGQSSRLAFHPSKWYRTQGLGSSQLLLINQFYYGLLKPLLSASVDQVNVNLQVSPLTCLDNVTGDQLQQLINDYLLQDFYVNEKTVKNPFTYSDDVEICTANIADNDGWGKLVYRCCGFNSDKVQLCSTVQEEDWVWALQAVIITLTIILFFYFPSLIPSGYRIYSYTYTPKDELTFRFIKTKTPQRYQKRGDKTIPKERQPIVLGLNQLAKMPTLYQQVTRQHGYAEDVRYTAHIKRVSFNVSMDRLIIEGGTAVSAFRSLFDSFIMCKIRRSDPLKDCCYTPACGVHCCKSCPPWKSWLRAVRTIVVMLVLAGPAIPFFYAISSDGLLFQELDKTYETLGLARTFNFYVGPIFGKVIVGILGLMYLIHITIVVVDGATDRNISQLYMEILNLAEKKDKISSRIETSQSLISKACGPIRKCGVLIIPFYILAVVLVPLVALILLLVHAPMIQIVKQGVQKILQRLNWLSRRKEDVFTFYNACELFWFFFSAIGVSIVLTIGANFLVNVLVVAIVTVIVQADLLYRVLPVVLILVIYVRDAYGKVGVSYDIFFGKVIGTLRSKVHKNLSDQALKTIAKQKSKIYKVDYQKTEAELDDVHEDKNVTVKSKGRTTILNIALRRTDVPQRSNIFLVKNSSPRLRLRQLLLFFSQDDLLYLSKKFFYDCCTMCCAGAPGALEENYINATLQFAKIGIFLLFVFLVVMAYGSSYYISPTNHLFVTLVSGLVPLIIRNVFSGTSSGVQESLSNYRFEAQLNEKIKDFSQSWDIEDIQLKDRMQFRDKRRDISGVQDIPSVDLILDMSHIPRSFDDIKRLNSVSPSVTESGNAYDTNDSETPVIEEDEEGAREDRGRNGRRNPARGGYTHEGHAAGVARAEAAHRGNVLADIDAHLVTNAVLRNLGLIPESEDATRDRGNSKDETPGTHTDGETRDAAPGHTLSGDEKAFISTTEG
ncbi:uncharacterized protein LOC106061662 isoform X1 [Biomphalaria glabrata]|uniref:Uncharacterized protein LOC106061662 isoform X1 n=1 Tax=Biomphalaria glabrata TaxID=6526 RepID=A0A9U8E753_BIOGL|nr:uncharacterized protein LOC106061662 isoform X1 [Biomphalaria glabrata]